MAKRPRRKIVKAQGPQPLYVLAGLPPTSLRDTLAALAGRYPLAMFRGIPAPIQDGHLYSRAYVEALLRSAGEFAVRRRENNNAQPTPASITLLFVPTNDQDRLLESFDFIAMSAPLTSLIVRDEKGRQIRSDTAAATEAALKAIAPAAEASLNLVEVKRRLGFASDNEALLLPPNNFRVGEGDLRPVFRSFRNAERKWNDRLADLGPTALSHEDVPARIAKQQTRRPFVDTRGVAYFIAHPTAYDGGVRERSAESELPGFLSVLRSLYRFGGSLPSGLHHDAQRSDGSALGGSTFYCSEKGEITVSDQYANVYPDDFVRVKKWTKNR